MGEYIEVARVEEIPKNEMKLIRNKGLEILLVNANGKFYAVENRCPHMGYPLCFGNLEGTTLTCGFHYARLDVITGKPLNKVSGRSLKTFKLRVKDSGILVKL